MHHLFHTLLAPVLVIVRQLGVWFIRDEHWALVGVLLGWGGLWALLLWETWPPAGFP